MSNRNLLFSGFGGQGILFTGKFIAYKSLLEDKNVSWLPSYGPEMRGGTANCSVIVGDESVGSPIVTNPDVLVAMNLPSLDKYENAVKSNGIIFADSSLIDKKVQRDDVTVYYIPATALAGENGIPTLANMIIAGQMLKVFNEYDEEMVEKTLKKIISARKANLFDANLKAIKIGVDFEA
ncbi:MAG: 2-oxoacid:acceptor oxidoreductase family protein [Clostridia bacterium]|nr:2-oxoacid:acceptor oxidoreductase family protein [Clostridia bacterium]